MTKTISRYLVPICWLLFFAAALSAQSKIPVTGHVGAVGADPTSPTSYQAQFSLAYCGGNVAKVFGQRTITAQIATFTADSTGLLTGSIWPNDVITCGGVVNGTRYNVSWLVNGVRVGPVQCYQVLSSIGTFNLDTAIPCAVVPPPVPAPGLFDWEFRNLTLAGTLYGVNAIFTGDVTAGSFHFSSSGAHAACGSGSYADQLLADFTFHCTALPAAVAYTFNGRVGPAFAPAANDYSFAMLSGKLGAGQTDATLIYPGTFNKAQLWDHTPAITSCAATSNQAVASTTSDTAGNLTCTKIAVPATPLVLSFDAAPSDVCTPPTSTDSTCSGTITLPSSMGDANYSPAFSVMEAHGAYLSITITGTQTATVIPYEINCSFNCSVINLPVVHVIAVHH
jgi:hypothetical protein